MMNKKDSKGGGYDTWKYDRDMHTRGWEEP